MKGEGIFPNSVSTLLKFPMVIQTHPGLLHPNVDNWTRILTDCLPTLFIYSSYLTWPEAKCLSRSSWAVPGTVEDVLLLSTASPGLLTPWAILGIYAVLSSVHGIFILFGNMGRKHRQCKRRREAILDDVSYPKLQERQTRVWALVMISYGWCCWGEEQTQYPDGCISQHWLG